MTPTRDSAARAMTPTMARASWTDLPEPVRSAICEHTGDVYEATTISSGLSAAFSARLRTETGTVFAKGVPSARAAAQRREVAINPYVHPIAPRLLWELDTDSWHVLGFEHLDGRPANLAPHSTDLPAVAAVLGTLSALDTPPIPCKRIEDRWADAAHQAGADPDLLAGPHLLHTDLNPHNILITDTAVRIVDWSWPTLGAPWIDTACAVLWLIAEGHPPPEAEAWAAQSPTWATASENALTAFTTINATLWDQIAATDPRPWKHALRRAATAWAARRGAATRA